MGCMACMVSIAMLTTTVLANTGTTWHVNAITGDDAADGRSEAQPLKTIQKAADVVAPGDRVIVHPGVYFEHVQLKTVGTAEKPIVFRTDRVEKSRVILTGADPAIRQRKTRWELVDADLRMYAVPWAAAPARVLYSGTDLLPYPDLATLGKFRFADGYPGAKHGFAFENGRLFVRLHADDWYGPIDPNQHTMCVSPPKAGGNAGVIVSKPSDYGFGVLAREPAFVTLDGFTFETPGAAGVFVAGSQVTVRNSWFLGCHTGVAGLENSPDPTKTTNNVTIEYCDMTTFPSFEDMKEVIRLHAEDPWRGDRAKFLQKVYWWHRKGGFLARGYTYEVGIASNIGSDWIIRHNQMIDGFEFLSAWAVRWSRNLDVHHNRIERLVDNAIETEDHAFNLRFHDNLVLDVFEPVTWQPLGGPPWPGPVYIYRNVIGSTPASAGLWSSVGWIPGIFKIGAQETNWLRKDIKVAPDEIVRAAGEGFLAFNNTIVLPDHDVLTRVQKLNRSMENFHIFNNVIVARRFNDGRKYFGQGITFSHNVAVLESPADDPGAASLTDQGHLATDVASVCVWDPARGGWVLVPESPARGLRRPSSPAQALADAGAVAWEQRWVVPQFGPQPR